MLDSVLQALTWFALVLLGLGVVVYFSLTWRRRGLRVAWRRLLSKRLLLPAVAVLTLAIINASLVFVEPTQLGVVISIPSRGGIRPQAIESGLHWLIPVAERVVLYPRFWQIYTVSNKSWEGSKGAGDAIVARTADNQIVIVDCSLIFQIDPGQVVRLHIDWQDRYVNELLRPALRSVLRREIAKYTADEVNSDKRGDIIAAVDAYLQDIGRESGLLVRHFLLRNLTFTGEYAESIESKQVAFQGELQQRHIAERIKTLAAGRAQRVRLLAQARAAAVVIKASAQARALLVRFQASARALSLIAEALAGEEHLLRYRYIERLAPGIRTLFLMHEAPFSLPRLSAH